MAKDPNRRTNTRIGPSSYASMDRHILSWEECPGNIVASVNVTVNITGTVITPTQTVVSAQAGPMEFNLTFLNPIEPGDWVKQSIPFSYLALSAKSLDGAAHNVQVYSDISGVNLQNPVVFNEISNQAEWGSAYYAMKSANNVTFKIAQDTISRGLFAPIQAIDDPVVWTVGFTLDPVVNYTDPSGAAPRQRSLFYKTRYSSDMSLIVDFLDDFANASSRAQKLDQEILQGAAPISDLLGDLVSLSTAQVYGSTQLTIGTDADGNYNESGCDDVYEEYWWSPVEDEPSERRRDAVFCVPCVHHLPNYTIPYAAADLGLDYPNVTISNSNHNQGVEQSGNMLIMTYAHARATGDGSLISKYYSLLTSWADYLSNSTLVIHDQSSADGLTTNNQTNLAIKGILAIKAMSKMSSVVKRTADADKYSFTDKWAQWTLGYNLLADAWLDTGVVESSVFDGQSSFIDNLALTSSFSNFGMPIDSLSGDTSVAIPSWNLFVAAMSSNRDLRTNLIARVHNRASFNTSAGVFPLSYDSTHGTTIVGGASPAQGAMYAPLALTAPVVQITVNSTESSSSSLKATSHIGAISGGTAGGVAALILLVGAIIIVRRRRRQGKSRKSVGSSFSGAAMEAGSQMAVTPFAPTLVRAAPLEAGSQGGTASDGPTFSSEPLLPLSQNVAPVPVGLSSKELARLRSTVMRSPPARPWSSPSGSQTSNPPTTISTPERSSTATPPPETRRLQTEMEFLRREVQELRAERFEAPPSYGTGGGV
ncbi:hypothetical protein H4582DRAFT_2082848 [Lactarius indigo]|nr:hypothetical protein H4582DRAFT_2082848 [Lactarius indigo]